MKTKDIPRTPGEIMLSIALLVYCIASLMAVFYLLSREQSQIYYDEMKETQTYNKVKGTAASDEYYTPKEFITSLGHFDMDPCAAMEPLWRSADVMLNKEDDGLSSEWKGRVWLNPPYSAPLISSFMKKMGEHGDGIALIMPKFGSKMFREDILPNCTAIFILDQRIRFYTPDGQQQKSPICTNILVAYGEDNVRAIRESGLKGQFLFPEKRQ